MKYSINIPEGAFNKSYYPLLENDSRYLILYGGSGSGKSYFIAERYIYRLLTASKRNLLVVRNTGRSNRDSTFALLCQIINSWNLDKLFKVNKSDLRIQCINGNEIAFSGLDDVEKLKSVTFSTGELTDIWVEEASEIIESDFNQLDIRLRGKGQKKQIVLSFNPIDINHWIKRRFIDDPADNVTVHHSTYLDNEFIDDDYRKLLESYKEKDPYYYQVYCLGDWGVLGTSIFDSARIAERLKVLEKPVATGYFQYNYDGLRITSMMWVDDPTGYIKIYRHPEKTRSYCIGGDTAGEGSDYFIGQVLDENGVQCAVLRNQMDADLYTKQMYCLGMHYMYALLTIEVNFDTYPIKELERLGYNNMFVREVQDTFVGQVRKSHGFRTDALTRPRILSQLVEIVREHTELFNDKSTLEEMLTFVRNERGRAEAQNGAHDDLVMAMAIAHEGLKQVRRGFHFSFREKPESDGFFDFDINGFE